MTTKILFMTQIEIKNFLVNNHNQYDSVDAEFSHIDPIKGLINKVRLTTY